MKDGKRIELELPCSVTADAEGKVILYNDTLTEDDRGLIVSTRGIQDNLEIRTGERILYHYADNQFQKNKQMKGKMWADVRLPGGDGGRNRYALFMREQQVEVLIYRFRYLAVFLQLS